MLLILRLLSCQKVNAVLLEERALVVFLVCPEGGHSVLDGTSQSLINPIELLIFYQAIGDQFD